MTSALSLLTVISTIVVVSQSQESISSISGIPTFLPWPPQSSPRMCFKDLEYKRMDICAPRNQIRIIASPAVNCPRGCSGFRAAYIQKWVMNVQRMSSCCVQRSFFQKGVASPDLASMTMRVEEDDEKVLWRVDEDDEKAKYVDATGPELEKAISEFAIAGTAGKGSVAGRVSVAGSNLSSLRQINVCLSDASFRTEMMCKACVHRPVRCCGNGRCTRKSCVEVIPQDVMHQERVLTWGWQLCPTRG